MNKLCFRHEINISKELFPETSVEIDDMKNVLYTSNVRNLTYIMLCNRPNICMICVLLIAINLI